MLKVECQRAYNKEYHQRNKERINERHREYNQENSESLNKYKKEYRQKNKEGISVYNKKYKSSNSEYIKEYDKKYRQENKESINKKRREYRCKNREYINNKNKEWYHKKGISQKYNHGLSYTTEYKKLRSQKRRTLSKNGGELNIKTIQLVYEDNIKRYGTLTCYLCLKPVAFKKDHLEHKTPLSRGGTNEYNNLDIACAKCNQTKHNKTEKEYRLWLKR